MGRGAVRPRVNLAVLFLLLACAAPAWATFPTFAGACTLTSRANNGTGVDTVNLPASIASGDLIIIWHFSEGGLTKTVPSPWVELFDGNSSGGDGLYIAYLIASGGETTVVVTKSAGERFAAIACRITAASWHGTTPPEVSTGATGSSQTSDPDSVTASWGSDDNLFIAAQATDNDSFTATGWPSNYSGNQTNSDNVVSSSGGSIATRELAAASDDPGTFTITASDTWIAATVVVRGTGGAPPAAVPQRTLVGVGQ
jgi:hypothetical protein